MFRVKPRDTRDDVLVAVEDQEDIHRPDVAGVLIPTERLEAKRRAPVLRVARVVEIDRTSLNLLRDVLEVGFRFGHGAVDRRLVLRIQTERLGEAAVFRPIDLALRHQGNEVILDRLRLVLRGKGGRRFSRAAEADDQEDALVAAHRDDLAARMHGEPAGVVDLLVPHPQAALLRFAEVVRIEDAGDAGVQVDEDRPVVRISGGRQVRRVDHRDLWLRAVRRVVELLLHAGDVGVTRLDDQPGGRQKVRIIADDAIEHNHLLLADVVVLDLRPFPALLGPHGLRRVLLGAVGDDIGALGAAGVDPRLDVEVVVDGALRVRHPRGQGLEGFWGRPVDQTLGLRNVPATDFDRHSLQDTGP